MKSLYRLGILGAVALSLGAPATAQRALEIDASSEWTHPHSGIGVPSSLVGIPRTGATEFAPDFLNLGFSYTADGETITLYIYRDTNGGVPVWFEQARLGIERRDALGKPQLAYSVEAYGWPGAEEWQGQRAIYATPKSSAVNSTGLALFSINGWFVKMRASSNTRSPEELGQWIDAALSQVTPPESQVVQAKSVAVEDCAEKLQFKKKAKDAKLDGGAGLLGALLGNVMAEKVKNERADEAPKPAVAWCRDGALGGMQVAYRANASTDSYLIALGDSGIGVSVAPDSVSAILSQKSDKDKPAYAITVVTDRQRISFMSQDRLPSFKRVMEVINADRRTGSVSTWGEDSKIEINSDVLK